MAMLAGERGGPARPSLPWLHLQALTCPSRGEFDVTHGFSDLLSLVPLALMLSLALIVLRVPGQVV